MFSSNARVQALLGIVVSIALALTLATTLASVAGPTGEPGTLPTLAGWRSP